MKLPKINEKIVKQIGRFAPLITLVVVFVASIFIGYPHFLQGQNMVNILRQISYTGIIALGTTFVIVAGGIDLSVGAMTAMVGGIVIVVLNLFGEASMLGVGVAMLAGVAAGGLAGAFNGLIVTKGRIAPIIVTLGTMSIFRSLVIYAGSAGEFRSVNSLFPTVGAGSVLGLPVPIIVFVLLAVLLHLLFNNTAFGRFVCAIGANERVALYSAVNINRVKMITYIIGGVTVGITSVLWASRLNSVNSSNMGLFYELDAITAVVIGGTAMSGGFGSIWRTVLGCLTLGIINNMLNMVGVSSYLQGAVKGAVIIGAVLLQYRRPK
ncbi:MAG: ABC transporter permease [Spirochaetes bacterium]|nr:ABC transporter permease [Spirochaetota bacterium]